MSTFAIESFLHDLQHVAGRCEAFADRPMSVLDEYPLAMQEREELLRWDVQALANRGVSQLLLALTYMHVHGGPSARVEYIRLMNIPLAQRGIDTEALASTSIVEIDNG